MKLPFKKAQFLTSSLTEEEWPTLKDASGNPLPEIALIGRSNVGKSSLLNHLMHIKGLAKVSSTPGKTQRLNYFLIDEKLLLVDLPGYGYARVDTKTKHHWGIHLEHYLKKRDSLKGLLFLLDSRRTPNADDEAFLKWTIHHQIPTILILTKTDKLLQKQIEKQTSTILNALFSSSDEKSLSGFPLVHYSIKEGKGKRHLITLLNGLWD